MKDYSFYKRIIVKNYNPEKKGLTEGQYKKLYLGWVMGAPKANAELFERTCFFAYDMVARLFAYGTLKGDFEETLQQTWLILKDASEGKFYSENIRKKVQGCLPQDYEKFLKKVADCVVYSLFELNEKEKSCQFDTIQNSTKIETYLKNPEAVALTNVAREEIAKIINTKCGFSYCYERKEGIQKRRAQEVVDYLIHGMTQTEIAKENNLSPETVGKTCRQACRKLRRPDLHVKELLS